MLAVAIGPAEIIKVLLAKKPSINKKDKQSGTYLLYAASRGHGQAALIQIKNGEEKNVSLKS